MIPPSVVHSITVRLSDSQRPGSFLLGLLRLFGTPSHSKHTKGVRRVRGPVMPWRLAEGFFLLVVLTLVLSQCLQSFVAAFFIEPSAFKRFPRGLNTVLNREIRHDRERA